MVDFEKIKNMEASDLRFRVVELMVENDFLKAQVSDLKLLVGLKDKVDRPVLPGRKVEDKVLDPVPVVKEVSKPPMIGDLDLSLLGKK